MAATQHKAAQAEYRKNLAIAAQHTFDRKHAGMGPYMYNPKGLELFAAFGEASKTDQSYYPALEGPYLIEKCADAFKDYSLALMSDLREEGLTFIDFGPGTRVAVRMHSVPLIQRYAMQVNDQGNLHYCDIDVAPEAGKAGNEEMESSAPNIHCYPSLIYNFMDNPYAYKRGTINLTKIHNAAALSAGCTVGNVTANPHELEEVQNAMVSSLGTMKTYLPKGSIFGIIHDCNENPTTSEYAYHLAGDFVMNSLVHMREELETSIEPKYFSYRQHYHTKTKTVSHNAYCDAGIHYFGVGNKKLCVTQGESIPLLVSAKPDWNEFKDLSERAGWFFIDSFQYHVQNQGRTTFTILWNPTDEQAKAGPEAFEIPEVKFDPALQNGTIRRYWDVKKHELNQAPLASTIDSPAAESSFMAMLGHSPVGAYAVPYAGASYSLV